MNKEKENLNRNIEINSEQSQTNQNDSFQKKSKKEKKILSKSSKKISSKAHIKVIPLLKPPSKRRQFNKNENLSKNENQSTGIIWDNKTIEEQYLDRKLHPRIKIDEPKTPYPDGDDKDLYQEGINKVNEIKPTEEIINNVIETLNGMEKNLNNSKTTELKKRAYGNEYTKALKFYKENGNKFDDLSGERKICLQNTLINKFHKEVRNLSKGKL